MFAMRIFAAGALILALAACAPERQPPPDAEYGPSPQLAEPNERLIPLINEARAIGWPEGAAPIAPEGFTVTRFAEGLAHPRNLYLLPNGDVLVAESSSRPVEGGGLTGWIANNVQRNAGAFGAGIDQITLLRDRDGDGVIDVRNIFARELNQPFGMAMLDGDLYVANTDSLVRYRYALGDRRVIGAGERVLELPYNDGDNGHWTRNLQVSADGQTLFIAIGSVTNIADQDMAIEQGRAAIWAYDRASGEARSYATGLRNPVGMDVEPVTGALWVAVNERDMLGDALVPDYMTAVRDGAFYGWPYSYFGQTIDTRVQPQDPGLVATAIAPDFALGAHTASLGLHFYQGEAFPDRFRGGAFIGQHGSWNRSVPAGYKVAFVPFDSAGAPQGGIEDFLTGFLNEDGAAYGRPVGITMDSAGALLVADDVGDIIWRVAYAPS